MKKKIICIDVNHGKEEYFFELLKNDILNKNQGYVCFSNVHMLIESYDDDNFKDVVNTSKYAFPDGYPIAKSFKWLYGLNQNRIAGMDFFPKFLEICDVNSFRVAIVGGSENVLAVVAKKINEDYKNIVITATISPPYNKTWNNDLYIESINRSNTDVVFVALGCPKQEKWMYEQHKRIKAMLFGIGGALPTYAGVVKRAPKWMQNNGLEWLYRLYCEPQRMFYRYFYTNTKFIYLLLLTKWKLRSNESK